MHEAYAVMLWLLLLLFVMRVLGQLLVFAFHTRWLPPMSVWYSGVVPYRLLLPAQIVLIVLMTAIAIDFTRGAGTFVEPRRPDIGSALIVAGWVYVAAMLARLARRILSAKGRPWYDGGTVPTAFHFVLAAFVLTVGAWHAASAP
jgi:hypothetical protein